MILTENNDGKYIPDHRNNMCGEYSVVERNMKVKK